MVLISYWFVSILHFESISWPTLGLQWSRLMKFIKSQQGHFCPWTWMLFWWLLSNPLFPRLFEGFLCPELFWRVDLPEDPLSLMETVKRRPRHGGAGESSRRFSPATRSAPPPALGYKTRGRPARVTVQHTAANSTPRTQVRVWKWNLPSRNTAYKLLNPQFSGNSRLGSSNVSNDNHSHFVFYLSFHTTIITVNILIYSLLKKIIQFRLEKKL